MSQVGKIEALIEAVLKTEFQPTHIEVRNESSGHNVPEGSETHFKVTLVSKKFEHQSLVTRHRGVYGVLDSFIKGGVHALALHTFTLAEWEKREATLKSPPCLGGE